MRLLRLLCVAFLIVSVLVLVQGFDHINAGTATAGTGALMTVYTLLGASCTAILVLSD